MNGLLGVIFHFSRWANVIAGITLAFMMFFTVMDVILRSLGKPIVGAFELVAFSGAVVIGFAVPFTSWVRGHIYVETFVMKFSGPKQNIFHITTRCMGIGLFLLIGWNLIKIGVDLHNSGEVSPTLQLPFYPVLYGLGISSLLQCFVLFGDIVKIAGGRYE
jgi:TRAP-type C4-dicarboxylate transport system permease small subunit